MWAIKLIGNLYIKIQELLWGPVSKFRRGDSVQLCNGGYLMVVVGVHRNRKFRSPVIECKWFDPETRENRTNVFHEEQLIFFDWNREMRKL